MDGLMVCFPGITETDYITHVDGVLLVDQNQDPAPELATDFVTNRPEYSWQQDHNDIYMITFDKTQAVYKSLTTLASDRVETVSAPFIGGHPINKPPTH